MSSKPKGIDWDAVADLGKVQDRVIAERLGVSKSAVQTQRAKRGIASCPRGGTGSVCSQFEWSSLPLGVETDAAIAARLGINKGVVQYQRRRRGIQPSSQRYSGESAVSWSSCGDPSGPPQPPEARARGRVYFVSDGDGAPVKVGFASTGMRRRLATLQVGNHRPLKLLAVAFGTREAEALLHMHLRAHRLSGEWFRPSECVHFVVERIASGRVTEVAVGVGGIEPVRTAVLTPDIDTMREFGCLATGGPR